MPLLPDDLLAAAQGGDPMGGPPQMMGDPGGPPEIQIPGDQADPGAPPGADDPGESEPIKVLSAIIEMLKHYHDVEPDEEDKAKAVGALKMIQDLLAKDQSDKAGALGNPGVQRVLRKAA